MPTGIRTTLNGITIAGITYIGVVDLENVFEPRGSATAAANVGFRNGAGADLSTLFYPRSAGGTTLEVDTGLRTGASATDLRQLYAKKGTVSTAPPPGGGGGGCLPFDTPVLLWDEGTKPLGEIRPGDVVIGYYAVGMLDESVDDWRQWTMPRAAAAGGMLIPVTVATTMISTYPRHYLINGALRATYEHPFLVLRDEHWGWQRAEHLRPGDAFLGEDLDAVPIASIELIEQLMDVANINVEEVDNFLIVAFDGLSILSHNSNENEFAKN